jgi:integrase/recombinase XerD
LAKLKRDSFYHAGDQWTLHFDEKGGKSREIPARHDLKRVVFEYLDAAYRKTGQLTENAMDVVDVCRMVKRRLKDAFLPSRFSPHSFRVTTITGLIEQGSKTCGAWPATPTRAPPASTTRRDKKITRNIVERIPI